MSLPSIPGYVGALQVGSVTSFTDWSEPLPIWTGEYGGSLQPKGIYLACGGGYADVFPDRQNVEMWTFTGPARNDFNPWNSAAGGFSVLSPGTFATGQLVQLKLTIYPGTEGLGRQYAICEAAFIVRLRWSWIARGQMAWICSVVAAWEYQGLNPTASNQLFRIPGGDTPYGG